jgi:tetratricopeptide (TPR) repeat protein
VQNNLGATYGTMARLQKGKAAIASFHAAVGAYTSCLEERTRDRDSRNWALTEYNLGLVLTDLAGIEDGTEALQQAVAAFGASLEVYGQTDSPVDWADAQDGLGWVQALLGQRTDDLALLKEGRAAVEAAYEVYKDYDGAGDYYEKRLARIDKMIGSLK